MDDGVIEEFRLNDRSDYDDFIKLVESKDDNTSNSQLATAQALIEKYSKQ